MFSVALIATCVIFSVISRYFFGISFVFLEEFVTTVFAFSTLWGIGICIMEDEMVVINTLYNKFSPRFKVVATYFNYSVSIVILVTMILYGIKYVNKFGNQISNGMRAPMKFMYGIIPIGCTIALFCLLIKLVDYTVTLIHKDEVI